MDEERSEEYRKLRNMEIFGWYMKGARAMLRRISEVFKEDLLMGKNGPYNKAVLDMIYDSANTENFLLHNYDQIRFKNHIRDKKGRLKSCEAYLVRFTQGITEVHEGDGI